MKIIYFGSSNFSLIVLKALYQAGFVPLLVVSQPDKPKGRGLKSHPTEVSVFTQEINIPLIKPASLKEEKTKNIIMGVDADLFIVADYGKILSKSILSIPKIASLGVHPSLLPAYRGPAPINWALIKGDKETGATIFKMDETLDGGEIILQEKVVIEDDDNSETLHEKLASNGAKLLIKTIPMLGSGTCVFKPQNETLSSFAPKLKKEDGKINWTLAAEDIRNIIRATLGWPSAYTYYKNKLIKVIDSEVLVTSCMLAPSTIVNIDKTGLSVATGNGILKIKLLKPEGKKEMDAYSFVLGHKMVVGDKLG